MKTHRIARIELDQQGVERDLEVFSSLKLSTAYSDYLCGGPWLSCLLWAPNGASENGLIDQIEDLGEAQWTPEAARMPAVRRVIESHFQLGKLSFARLAMVMPGSVIIPHRDLLELESSLHRFHVPMRTDRRSLFADGSNVFHMAQGEIWALDASDQHSVLCDCAEPRIHLILDYREDALPNEMSHIPPNPGAGVPPDARIERPPLVPAQREALTNLAGLLDLGNHRTIIELVTRQLYSYDVEVGFVWSTLHAIADRANDRMAAERLYELEEYFLLARDQGTAPAAVAASG